MKKQITSFKEIYIPKPCHQDWDTMSVVEKGKFCESCKKVVYDFTDKTESEFNLLYQQNKGNICVRFEADQIDQDYAYIAQVKNNKLHARVKRMASFLITFIVLKLSSIRTGYAQQSTFAATSFGNSIKLAVPDPNYRRAEKADAAVKGKVLKEGTENGLPSVHIILYDQKGNFVAETLSDAQGDFVIVLPDTLNLNQPFLITADKEKIKNRARVTKYSGDEKEITEKEFDAVVLVVDVHKRVRRDLLGRKKSRGFVGCPKFR